MVQPRLGTQHTVVHPTVVELYGRGELRHVMSLNSHVTSSMTSSSIKFLCDDLQKQKSFLCFESLAYATVMMSDDITRKSHDLEADV